MKPLPPESVLPMNSLINLLLLKLSRTYGMQKNKWYILSTGQLEPQLLQKAAEQNIFIDCIDFIDTEAIHSEALQTQIEQLSQQKITAVFTSANAVEAVKNCLNRKADWEIFCIGNATQK